MEVNMYLILIFDFINLLLQFWIEAHWSIALAMSALANIVVFLVTAAFLDHFIEKLVNQYKVGVYIDNRQLKPKQKSIEIRSGIIACFIFSATSLLVRVFHESVWPASILTLTIQIFVFTIYYETYSYFVHRLLHTKYFRKIHKNHHDSIRVTPWSAYSVHPLEAILIGMSAPIFMFFYPLSLGVMLTFHIFGMIFTIFIHSNFLLESSNSFINMFFKYPRYHSIHHTIGKVNYGFVNSFWDNLFLTSEKVKKEV